ncbi:MAG: outer membrane protein transport protein [Rhizobiaceae bacterium]
MARSIITISALALVASVGAAQAGGFSRGAADTDILYEDGNFNLRNGVTYVSPSRKFTVNANPALVGTNYTEPYAVFSGAVKLNLTDDLRCSATYSQPYGGSVAYAAPSLPSGKLIEDFTISEMALTCGYKFDLAKGRAWILGGIYQESFDYERVNFRTATTRFHLGLNGTDFGFRVGAAYEIPEIALRAQLMYRAASSYGADGTLDVRTLAGTTVASFGAIGTGQLPQSVEMKLQSGIAPGWLAFGSVKWTDWSVTEQLIVNVPAIAATQTNDYFWKDGWTVTAGIGHAFNEQWSGAASITWDKGVGTGYDLSSDTWTFGAGGSYKDSMGGELRFGGGVTYITSAAENKYGALNTAVDGGWAYALTASYKTKW